MFIIRFSEHSLKQITTQAYKALDNNCAEWKKNIWNFVLLWGNEVVSEIEITTSGSTGLPKAIKHTKTAMVASARATCEALQLKPGCTALLCLPANKIAGMMMIVRSIVNKMDLLCIQPSAVPFPLLPDNLNISFAAFTPMQVKSIDKDYQSFRKLEAIQTVLLGGEHVSTGLIESLKHATNSVYATFGMTETISHIALKKVIGNNTDEHFKTLPGIEISTDGDGRLIISAPALNIHNLKTNDIIHLVSSTEFDWLGRADNIVNTGGVKIYPEAIEQKLLSHFSVAFFVGAIEDKITGQKPVLVIELPALTNAELAELRECISKLDKYERPSKVYLIPEFVRTNAKINRTATLRKTPRVVLI